MDKRTRSIVVLITAWIALTLLAGVFLPAASVSARQITIPTPLSPTSIITDKTPTFTWSAVTGAKTYQLEVWRNSERIYIEDVASTNCSAGTCAYTPAKSLMIVGYKWRVNVKGNPFSAFKSFIISRPPWNIRDGFPGDMMLWETKAGGKWSVSDKAIYSKGLPQKYSSIYYTWSRAYADYEISSKLKVEGSPVGGVYPEAYIAVRMDSHVKATDLAWYSGYLFGYYSNGKYAVWKMNKDGSRTALAGPTYSPYIHKNGSYSNWNWLRVVVDGNKLDYYMNDQLLVSLKDSSYSIGFLGFEMKNPGSTPTTMYVDWVSVYLIE